MDHKAFKSVEELMAWLESDPEPIPFTCFDMSDSSSRREFLLELYMRGKPALFEAVSYAWEVLEEPRAWRATGIAEAAGLTGTGKWALYAAFDKFIDEGLATDTGLPPIENYASLDEWNEAVSRRAKDDELALNEILDCWTLILMGQAPGTHATRLGVTT